MADTQGIIVLSCPRSGSTLLRRLLGGHSNISAPGETYLLSACARFLREAPVVDGLNVGVLNGLGFLGFSEDEIIARLRKFAFEFHSEHAAKEGKSRWVEKTAIDAFHVREIERLCAEHAQFICVVRHGLDVACSMLDWVVKAQSIPDEIHDYVKHTPRLLEAFALAWRDSTDAICDFAERHPDNAQIIRYEDLVADPEAALATILNNLGEEFEANMLEAALQERDPKGFSDWKTFSKSAVQDDSVARWKKLSPDTIGMLAPIVNPVLSRTGYDEVQGVATQDQNRARDRYLTGLLLQSLR